LLYHRRVVTPRLAVFRLAAGAALLATACDGGAVTGEPMSPTTSAVVCGGFRMPNPAIDGLPNPEAYVDNGDGTVTDQVTRLVWERTVDPQGYPQLDEVQRCATKGGGWRLPTRLELLSLVDFSVPAPGPTINAIFGDAPDQVFWTASGYYDNAGDAWVIGFDRGYSDYGVRNNPNLGRCVRAPAPTCGAKRYEVQPGALVADHATGLVWQRALDPGSYTYPDARAYCAGLGAGWRVPSLKELQTIVEDTDEFPAIDPDAFPDTPSVDFWTSSLDASGSGSAWYVDFFYGASDNDVQTRTYRVRCVR
jgi:Protein of unknown function (DUF1566)